MFLLLFGFYLLGNLYVFLRLWQTVMLWPVWAKCVFVLFFWGCASSFVVSMLLRNSDVVPGIMRSLFSIGSVWLAVVLYLTLFLLITDVVRLFNNSFNNGVYYAILLCFIVLCCGYYHYVHPHRKVINIVINKSNQQFEDKVLKVVAVSDVHLGYGTTRKMLHRYVEMINAEQPDLILIGGDLIDSSVVPLYEENMQEELSRLNAKYGVYMVPGNHEYITGIRHSLHFLEQTPIQVLRDSVVTLPMGIQLVGRDDRWRRSRKSLQELMEKVNPGLPVLLLDHQPMQLEETEAAGVDLQFSGHTHRGQLWPFSWVTDYLFQQSHGYRKWGGSHIYVSSGLSLWGPPFRIGTDSEMVVFNIELKSN